MSYMRSDLHPARSACQAHGLAAQVALNGRLQRVRLRDLQAVVCTLGYADPPHEAAHRDQTVHLPGVRSGLFAIGPFINAPADSYRRKTLQVKKALVEMKFFSNIFFLSFCTDAQVVLMQHAGGI